MDETLNIFPYVGRFAPLLPALCARSLVAALTSYPDARAHDGKWPVRMEDIDPPGEQPKAAGRTLRALDALGLHWDDGVLFQSDQSFDLSTPGDFILKRKGGLSASQLVVCVDDYFQGISNIIRGVGILDSTPIQLNLQSQLLNYPHPL